VPAPDGHRVTRQHAEVTGQHGARKAHGERGIVPAAAGHGPQLVTDLEVHRAGEDAVHLAGAGRAELDDRPDGLGTDAHREPYEIAASALPESETQPKMAPCALIISSPTRWNSGKYDATQSDRTTHS